MISYLGWVSAQITALGLVFSVLTNGAIQPWQGMILGVAIVLVWTLSGGMLSVAFTDLFQMSVIMVGHALHRVRRSRAWSAGPAVVIDHASAAGKLEFWPELKPRDVIAFVAAWATMALGSIPQQDVFQRVAAAKNERTAATGSVIGGCLYFCFAFVPMYLAYSAMLIDPALVEQLHRHRFAADPAAAHPHARAFRGAGLLLRRADLRDPVVLVGDAARAFGHGRGEPAEAAHAEAHRPAVPAHAAHRRVPLRVRGAHVRAHLDPVDLRHGRERLQDHARRGVHAARFRPLLEARDDAGRGARDGRGPRHVARARIRRTPKASCRRSSRGCSRASPA